MTLSLDEANIECRGYRNSILTCNVQSINKNFNAVKDLIYKLDFPSINVLVEIWQPKIQFRIQNYHDPINFIRENKRGGGISIIIHESLRFTKNDEINQIKCTQIEKLAVNILDKNGKKILLLGCYRPPNSNLKKSFEELETIFKKAHLTNLPVVITGDMNINLHSTQDENATYHNLLQKFQFIQIVKEPTRITKSKKSLLDHVLINSKMEPIKAHTLCFSIADHLPILTLWNKKSDKKASETEILKGINYKKLDNIFRDFKIDNIEEMNCNEAFDKLHQNVTEKIEACRYNLNKKQQPKNPWISQECIKLGIELHRIKRKFIRNNTAFNDFMYRKTKKEYQKMIRKEKENYYKRKLDNFKGDSYKTWRVINDLLYRKSNKNSNKNDVIVDKEKTYSTEREISTFMNIYFKDIAVEIGEKIEKSKHDYEYYLQKSTQLNEPFNQTLNSGWKF